jgi:catechol 2,3-dioxygenase-like lactoylglutathione lyase family enzyme
MYYDSIDSVLLAVADLDQALRPYERLGLRLSAVRPGRRTLLVGGTANPFTLHFLADAGDDAGLAGPLRRALAAGRGLFATCLRVPDVRQAVDLLAGKGIQATICPDQGREAAWLPLHDQAGTDLLLVQSPAVTPAPPAHGFPLKRLDHLAAVAHDLDAKTRFWAEVLGVPVAGEVATPAMTIRQLRIGDAVLELLGPAAADSPLWQRPPGLVSMSSWEVTDLGGAVRQARVAGFTVPDPAAGVLPGTRVATVPGAELAGVNMQLLQYV